jgi:hypothetical protein
VVILLLGRLVLGEVVHAHEPAVTEVAAAQCHGDVQQHDDEPDCCKTDGCACLCLLGAAVAPGAALTLGAVTESAAAVCAAGIPLDRLSALFRPPASLPLFA